MACTCVNGGVCLDTHIQICECPFGFEGNRCQDLAVVFTHKKSETNLDVIAIVVVVLFVTFASMIFFYFMFRRIRSRRKHKIEEMKARNRRQSKATIEGITVTGFESDNEEKAISFERATETFDDLRASSVTVDSISCTDAPTKVNATNEASAECQNNCNLYTKVILSFEETP